LSTPTARIGLLKPARSDTFVTQDLADNWQKVDDHILGKVCTSGTRPSWGAAQAGMLISETDTGLTWRWTGSAWARLGGVGRLRTTTGAYATALRTTLFSTSSVSTYVVALTLSNVVVPDGLRPIEVRAIWDNSINSAGFFYGVIVRSASVGGPTVGGVHQILDGMGGEHTSQEASGLAPGAYTYSYQVRSPAGGTSQLSGLALQVTEV
jgi:hypothetical protein